VSTPQRRGFLGAFSPGTACGLRLERTGAWVIERLQLAGDSAQRRRGLLGRGSLGDGEGLVIAPSQGIHTFGMQFPIDVIGVARDGRVLKIRRAVPPRRLVFCLRAFAMVELAAGAAARLDVQPGDMLRGAACTHMTSSSV
jgi:uncharacterized membrane protein (UPF0127 family)